MVDFLASFFILGAKNMNSSVTLWAIVSEVGFIIAVPLVFFMLLAIKADRYFDTAPLFMIGAILISPVISGVAIWRKIRALTAATAANNHE